ncbi:MAG: DOMON-like domain-containing protein, partial [Cyanobium sp.]
PLAPAPQRRDELWKATCLELFLALPEQEGYREFNLSPSGDWNVYQLSGYRQGLQPDPAWQALPFTRRDEAGPQSPAALVAQLTTTLPADLAAAPVLEAAVTAVLQLQDGSCCYWALRHPGEEADFHRRDGFALRL